MQTIADLLSGGETVWGMNILVKVVNIEDVEIDQYDTKRAGSEIVYRKMIVSDDTAQCPFRMKMTRTKNNTGGITKERLEIIKEGSRLRLENVGFRTEQKAFVTVRNGYNLTGFLIDDEIDDDISDKYDD